MNSRDKLISMMDRLVELKALEINLYAACVKLDPNAANWSKSWKKREANCVKIRSLEEKLKTAIAARSKFYAKHKAKIK